MPGLKRGSENSLFEKSVAQLGAERGPSSGETTDAACDDCATAIEELSGGFDSAVADLADPSHSMDLTADHRLEQVELKVRSQHKNLVFDLSLIHI